MNPVLVQSLQLLTLPYDQLLSFLEKISTENPFVEMNWDEIASVSSRNSSGIYDSGRNTIETQPEPNAGASLQDSLRYQLDIYTDSKPLLKAGYAVIACIDDRGWCTDSAAEIARAAGLNMQDVQQALHIIQSFEPKGVGASTLAESLLLQADPVKCDKQLLAKILSSPLKYICSHDYKYFSKTFKASVPAVKKAFGYMASLNPFPGYGISSSNANYIYPDIEIEYSSDSVSFRFQSGCEALTINKQLYNDFSARLRGDDKAMNYIRRQYHDALALSESLRLRKNTIEKIMMYLIDYQQDYFFLPDGKLLPLTMKKTAEEVGLNLSTVSRCISGRYIQTKNGVVPLKSLFSSALYTSEDESISSVEVKSMIRSFISKESHADPLRDEDISRLLKNGGIQVSRRTVAKYRTQLNIAGRNERRIRV